MNIYLTIVGIVGERDIYSNKLCQPSISLLQCMYSCFRVASIAYRETVATELTVSCARLMTAMRLVLERTLVKKMR